MIGNGTRQQVTLPGGYWLDGLCHRVAELRSLTGDDEVFLLDVDESLFPAQQVTALLARCLISLGSLQLITGEVVRSLTVGDREALLLHLRRLTLDDRLQCVLNCPNSVCGEKMDLDLRVGDLLLLPYPHSQEWHEITLNEGSTSYQVCFRLPTGADQEASANLAQTDLQTATNLLLRRCVKWVTQGEQPEPLDELPAAVEQQLPALMAELDPQAELMLNLNCPVCQHRFSALLDTATYFFQELSRQVRNFYWDVHLLAFHYHWSEAEIMAMPPRRRHLYLDLLADALTEGGRR